MQTKFIDFGDKLLSDTNGPVFLIVDGHPVHRAQAVIEYVTSTQGRLRLFHLPSYSPELNPRRMGLPKCRTSPHSEPLTRLPRLIRAFFGDPNLRYITA